LRKFIELPIREEISEVSTSDVDDDGILHVRVSKDMIRYFSSPYFDIDNEISNLSEILFDIDKESKIILGVIAKNGPITEKKISELSFRRSHNIIRDNVRYRLNSKKNKSNLINEGFVTVKIGKKIGNIKSRSEKFYHLTFKGFLASLAKTRFDENYLIKLCSELIEYWIKKYNISENAVLWIKYNLGLFLAISQIEAINLTKLDHIQTKFYELNEGGHFIDPTYRQQVKDKRTNKLLLEIRIWFHVYSQVLNKIMKQITGKKPLVISQRIDKDLAFLEPRTSEVLFNMRFLPSFIRFWYMNLDRLQFENLKEFNPNIIPEELEPQNMKGIDIDIFTVNVLAKKILKKHRIPTNFSVTDAPMFSFTL